MAGKPQQRASKPVAQPVEAPADPKPIKHRLADLPLSPEVTV